jgi:diketogulonate reductase-like aldo/keto reductase
MMKLLSLSASTVPLASAAAPSVTLNNGLEMPVVSIGTWQYNASEAHDAIVSAVKVGFTHIDTAHDYDNEEGVALGMRDSGLTRDEIFLTTKIPGCGLQGVSIAQCYQDTLTLHNQNLQMLNTTHSDLLLIHFPPITGCALGCKDIQNQWKAMEEILEKNLSRAIGA